MPHWPLPVYFKLVNLAEASNAAFEKQPSRFCSKTSLQDHQDVLAQEYLLTGLWRLLLQRYDNYEALAAQYTACLASANSDGYGRRLLA